MKKFIVVLAAAAMTASFAAKADNNKQCNQKQCNQPACNQPCDTACTKAPCPPQFCPFDGLNLTDAQKQQFKELRAKKQQAKKDAKAERKADRQAAKKAQLEEIKVILTPEQYVLFLENNFVNGDGNRFVKHAGKPEPRGDKQMRKGERRSAPAAKMIDAKAIDKPVKK